MARRGVPIVVSAPSGCGKTTMCHRVIDSMSEIEFSVSYTTRPPRVHETPDVDYHFVNDDAFKALIREGAFLEWAQVFNRLYGTGLREARARLDAGVDVLFDIDVQGGRQMLDKLPEAVLVFIVPPDMQELERRLRDRQTDSAEEIDRRLKSAAAEIKQATFYTHWIVNDSLDEAVDTLETIVRSERLRHVDKAQLMKRVLG